MFGQLKDWRGIAMRFCRCAHTFRLIRMPCPNPDFFLCPLNLERFFSWLQSYRHITVRYDYYAGNYFSMIQLACIMIHLNLILR